MLAGMHTGFEKKQTKQKREKTTALGLDLMRSQVLYWDAQVWVWLVLARFGMPAVVKCSVCCDAPLMQSHLQPKASVL